MVMVLGQISGQSDRLAGVFQEFMTERFTVFVSWNFGPTLYRGFDIHGKTVGQRYRIV